MRRFQPIALTLLVSLLIDAIDHIERSRASTRVSSGP
jgi:hypothetical protein